MHDETREHASKSQTWNGYLSLSWSEIFLGRCKCFGTDISPNSTGYNTDHENTCPFSTFIGSSISTFRNMYLIIVWKTKIDNILFKIQHIYLHQIYKNSKYRNLFFIYLFHTKLDKSILTKKNAIFFRTKSFCW